MCRFTLTGGWINKWLGLDLPSIIQDDECWNTHLYPSRCGYTLDTCDIYSVTSPGSGSMRAQMMVVGHRRLINLASANGLNLTTITGDSSELRRSATITQVSGTIFGGHAISIAIRVRRIRSDSRMRQYRELAACDLAE